MSDTSNKTTPASMHLDGWSNLLSGLGGKNDKSRYNTFTQGPVLDYLELSAIWDGEGLGSRVVAAPAEDMTRAWLEITEDKDGKYSEQLRNLKWQRRFYEGVLWSRLYGGALMVIGTKDGDDLSKPMSSNPREITFLKVYPCSRVYIYTMDIISDPTSPYFEQVSQYQVYRDDGNSFVVHRSRCIEFHGNLFAPYDPGVPWERKYWGMSALQQPWDTLTTVGSTFSAASNILQEFSVGVFTLANLAQLLAENNNQAIYNRIEIMNASKSIINSVLLGEGEEYRRESSTLTGIDNVIDRFMMLLSGTTGIPVTRLFGRSAAGMNATGEGDMQQYYDRIESNQESDLRAPVQEFLNIFAKTVGAKKLTFEFNPVWTPSQKELIEMQNKQANTDKLYVDMQVLSADEIRENRFGGQYSFNTTVDAGSDAPVQEEPAPTPTNPIPGQQQ